VSVGPKHEQPNPGKEMRGIASNSTRSATNITLKWGLTGLVKQTAYACPKPDCSVRYSPSNGYFLAPEHGQVESYLTPRVTCPCDGQRMYLAEINREKRAFRLWRCPQCDASRTNEEGLVS